MRRSKKKRTAETKIFTGTYAIASKDKDAAFNRVTKFNRANKTMKLGFPKSTRSSRITPKMPKLR